ncbi:MAG: RimK family protein [Candidatus Omnitrophica bacterium]|nr:RimK family protein [Candidatus Omnitrophota bacterium]
MSSLVVVKNPKDWPIHVAGVEVVSAGAYLTEARYAGLPNAKVYNLCRSYSYQSAGYYVSLLAAARGHKPLPDVSTLQNMRSAPIVRLMSEEIEELIQKHLKDIQAKEFVMSIYFGHNLAKRYDYLAWKLYNLFQAPFLRAHFVFKKEWELRRIMPIPASEIPQDHLPFVIQEARKYFARKDAGSSRKVRYSYELAILRDPAEKTPPSNKRALERFVSAAEYVGMRPEIITREDYGRIAEFDALFIRATTQVHHYTYQFARRAEAEGLAVIDDPESIIRCTNKVFLAEALKRHGVSIPETLILHRDQLESLCSRVSLPCVLKLPDSAYSIGVVKAETPEALRAAAERFFEKSELIVVQRYMPTAFDWRIGVLDDKPLYACRYHMALRHWQIVKQASTGKLLAGKVEPVPLKRVPAAVIETALAATRAVGHGLYGVDLKEAETGVVVIEVNDNASIDAGYEDTYLKLSIYRKIMKSLLRRVELIKDGRYPS